MEKENVLLFGMPNSQKLAKKISKITKIPLMELTVTKFADGEIMPISCVRVREKEVFIIASTSRPVNENIMELLLFVDSLRRSSAKSITVVLTYYGYARQDKKDNGRQPIGARLMADLLETAGVDRVIAVDLHNPAIQGFFNIPIDDLRGQYALAKMLNQDKFTVVSPDHGGAVRARALAEILSDDIKICIIDKRRTGPNQSEVLGLIGDIKDHNAVIIDDIIDTGGTIIKAAESLKKNGAKKIIVAATHGIFTRGFDIFENNDSIEKVIITDSIDNSSWASKYKKLEIASLDVLISSVIDTLIKGNSISDLYKEMTKEIQKNAKSRKKK